MGAVRKFLIVLAAFAIFDCCIYAVAPRTRAMTIFPGATLEYRSDLRDCFAEEIRLEGARAVLEEAELADIERFNRMVDVYNQACGNLTGGSRNLAAVEAIRSEVRANQNALWAEGIARFPVR